VAGSVQERIRANRPEHGKTKVRDHLPFTVAGGVKLAESARIDFGKNAVRVAAVRRSVHDGISGINQRKAGILSLLVAQANGPAVRNGVVEDNVHTYKIAVPGTGNKSLAVLLAFERHLGDGDADVMMKPLNLLLHTGKVGGNVNRNLGIVLLSSDTPGADGSGAGRKNKTRISYSPGAQRCLAVGVSGFHAGPDPGAEPQTQILQGGVDTLLLGGTVAGAVHNKVGRDRPGSLPDTLYQMVLHAGGVKLSGLEASRAELIEVGPLDSVAGVILIQPISVGKGSVNLHLGSGAHRQESQEKYREESYHWLSTNSFLWFLIISLELVSTSPLAIICSVATALRTRRQTS